MAYSYSYVEIYGRWSDYTPDATMAGTARRLIDDSDQQFMSDCIEAFEQVAAARLGEDHYEPRNEFRQGDDGVVRQVTELAGPPQDWDRFPHPAEWHRARIRSLLGDAEVLGDWAYRARSRVEEGADISGEDIYGY